jgi:hypothetical protein
MPKISVTYSESNDSAKKIKFTNIPRTKTVTSGLSGLDASQKLCKTALAKLKTLEDTQDTIEWENFVERKGVLRIVNCLKEHCVPEKVWNSVCNKDGDTPLEMSDGSDLVLKYFMPEDSDSIISMALRFPNLAFRVIVDEPTEASAKAREILSRDIQKELQFKRLMNAWYDDKSIDISSQFTLDYIGVVE